MREAGCRLFVYPQWVSPLTVVLTAPSIALAVAAVSLYLDKGAPDPGWTIGFGATLLFACGGIRCFFQMRPITFTEDRIECLLCGRPWQTIAWGDVDRIEKRVTVAADAGEVVYDVIRFRAGRRTIAVTSWIGEFAALKQLATEEAKRRGIEIVATRPHAFWRAPIVTPLDEL